MTKIKHLHLAEPMQLCIKNKKVTESARLIEIQNSPPIFSYDFTDGILTTHGKGGTIDQAKASCIMEFAERYSWLHFDYKKLAGIKRYL